MARWPVNAHPIIVMTVIAIGLDSISIGIVGSIAIGLDHTSIGFDSGLTVGSTVGCSIDSTWLYWAIDLSKAFDSSDKRLLRYQSRGFMGSFYGYYNSVLTLL